MRELSSLGLDLNTGMTSRYFPQSIRVAPASTEGSDEGADLFHWSYTTDAVGNPTAIADALDPANDKTYAYQPYQYFLTLGNGPWGDLSWTYDRIGNRLTETRDGATDVYSYLANAGNDGNTAILAAITPAGGGLRTYTYGPAGHLEEVALPANVIDFQNNAAGRLSRIERPAGDAAVDFTYDGRSFLRYAQASTLSEIFNDGFEAGDVVCWDLAVESNLENQQRCRPQTVAHYDSLGALVHFETKPQDSIERNTILRLGNVPIAEARVQQAQKVTEYYLTADHLGTSILLANASAQVTWQGHPEPFGTDSGFSPLRPAIRFPGQWVSKEWTEMINYPLAYNIHRWYQPSIGSYSKSDPLPMEIFREAQYAYVSANPLSASDPLGLVAFKACSELPSPRPCQCDKGNLANAAQNSRDFRDAFCEYRNSSERPPAVPRAGEGAETIGKIDPTLGPVYRPQGDPCREYCTCEHERQHERDMGSPRVRNLLLDGVPTQQILNWLECRAYNRGTFCLQGFARGGIP